jgi:hypothetical protein
VGEGLPGHRLRRNLIVAVCGRVRSPSTVPEIYERGPDGTPRVMTVHAERQFTGELDLFTNRAILVGGRIGADGRVARLGRAQFSAGCWPPSRTSRMW